MRGLATGQTPKEREDAVHAEQRQRHDEEAGDGAATHRDLDGLDEAAPGGRRGSHVGLHADVHADDPGCHRAGGTDDEGESRSPPEVEPERVGVGNLGGFEDRDHDADDNGADDGQDPDGRVLAPDECDRTFENGAGHVLHLLCPGVPRQDVPSEVDREQHRDDARRQDDQLERTRIHQGFRLLHDRVDDRDSARARGARHAGLVSGEMLAWVPGHARWDGTLQAVGECNKAAEAGSNSLAGDDMQPRFGRRRCSSRGPYTARLVTRRPMLGCLFEIVETLVLTLIIFLVIQNFVAQPYKVQQQSMEHTLEPDQYVLVDKLTPRLDVYKRGDIVVFTPPHDWATADETPFIKRVIGIGGDEVEIREGFVYVNDTLLDEPYIYADQPGDAPQPTTAAQDRWVVPTGELFLMGDHRANSADSRSFGPVPVANIIGRAWLRYWPVNVFGILPTPTHPELDTASP